MPIIDPFENQKEAPQEASVAPAKEINDPFTSPAKEAQPASPVAAAQIKDPFAKEEKPATPAPDMSAAHVVRVSAEKAAIEGVVPTATGWVGATAAVAAAQPAIIAASALFGPAAPVAAAVMEAGAMLIGGALGGYAGSAAQKATLSLIPNKFTDPIKEALGISDETMATAQQQHPSAAKYGAQAGSLIPQLAMAQPGKATPMEVGERTISPLAQHVAMGTIAGTQSIATQIANGESIDPWSVAMNTIAGATLVKQTAVGEALSKGGLKMGGAVGKILPKPKAPIEKPDTIPEYQPKPGVEEPSKAPTEKPVEAVKQPTTVSDYKDWLVEQGRKPSEQAEMDWFEETKKANTASISAGVLPAETQAIVQAYTQQQATKAVMTDIGTPLARHQDFMITDLPTDKVPWFETNMKAARALNETVRTASHPTNTQEGVPAAPHAGMDTVEHEMTVASLMGKIATRMGQKPEDVGLAIITGAIHDGGKKDPEILRLTSLNRKTTKEEQAIINSHVEGIRKAAADKGIDPRAIEAAAHHDRWAKDKSTTATPLDKLVVASDQFESLFGKGHDYPLHDEAGNEIPRTKENVTKIYQHKIDIGMVDKAVGNHILDAMNARDIPRRMLANWDKLPSESNLASQSSFTLPKNDIIMGIKNGKPVDISSEKDLAYLGRQSNYAAEADVTLLRQAWERASQDPIYTPENMKLFRDYSEEGRVVKKDSERTIQLNPQQKRFYDEHIEPMRKAYQDSLANVAKLSHQPWKEMETMLSTRFALLKQSAVDRLLGGETLGGFGAAGAKKPGGLKGLSYFGLRGSDSVITSEKGWAYRWKDGNIIEKDRIPARLNKDETGEIAHPNSLEEGDVVFGKRVTQAQQRHIEQHAPTRYMHDDMATWAWRIAEARKYEHQLATLETLKQSDYFKSVAVKKGDGDIPKKWGRLRDSDSIPQLRDYYFEPKTKEVLDDWVRANHGDRIAIIEAINNVSIKSFMINPTGHIMNEAVHWFVARGFTGFATPSGVTNLAKTFVPAFESVLKQDSFQIELAQAGGHLLSMSVKNHKAWQDIMTNEMKRQTNNGTVAEWAKRIGMAPIEFANLVSNKASDFMWTVRDAFYTQLIMDHKLKYGGTTKEAVLAVNQHMPSYEIPSRVLYSRGLSEAMQNKTFTVFSAYHYGMLSSIGNTGKELTSIKTLPKGIDHLAALAFLHAAVYPALDYLYQQMFNDPYAKARRAGPLHIAEVLGKVQKGEASPTRFASLLLTPSPGLMTVGQLYENVQFYNRQPVYTPSVPNAVPAQVGRFIFNQMLAPGQAATSIIEGTRTGKAYLEQQADVETTTPEKEAKKLHYIKEEEKRAKRAWEKLKAKYKS